MHSVLAIIIVTTLAFVGTMFDNFFAFAAQLLVTPEERHRRVEIAQALGVAALLVISEGVSSLLAAIPTRWIGLLALAPWALAVHAWRHRADAIHEQYRRGAITTFAVTLALGGDNLAVWIPLLRAGGDVAHVGMVALFAVWEIVFLACARALVAHPRTIAWGTRHAHRAIPVIYVALGVLILVECGTLHV